MRPIVVAAIAAAAGAAAAVAIRAAISERPRLTRARVLAEAVTTYRHPGQFFLVGHTAYPYRVIAAFATRDSAVRFAADSGTRLEVSGPYTGPSSAPLWEVLAITVRVRTADRETTLQYDPRSVDAVFLTVQAVDKFVVPYYKALYGRAFADSVRAAVVGGAPPKPPCHRYSFPCKELTPVGPQGPSDAAGRPTP